MKPFFISTPIYYPNDIPHIGHAYSSFIADTLARYQRISRGSQTQETAIVKFTTGVDENSQKILQKSAELGKDVYQFLDEMTISHRQAWDTLGVEYTDFVRTIANHPDKVAEHHTSFVQYVLQKAFEKGDIYEGMYEGDYCVGCESFKKPSDLVDGQCPLHPKGKIEHLKEKNYFFRLSRYEAALKELYQSKPDFVQPDHRFAEVRAFVEAGLEDFSISRESNTFGIPLPFDPTQVTYVWFDALYNYVSYALPRDQHGQFIDQKWQSLLSFADWEAARQDPARDPFCDPSGFWTAESQKIHVVGKDIIRFHAIFWPAMLMSAELPLPDNILTTGFFTADGQKMSKSIGNVVDPVTVVGEYGRDFLVNYLLGAFPIGNDGDFSMKEAKLMFNNRLANNIGNLLNRFLVLSLKLSADEGNTARVEITEPIYDVAGDPEWLLVNGVDFRQNYLRAMNYSFVDPLERVNNLTQASTEWYEESPGHLASRTGKEIIPTYDLRTALEMCFAYADTLNKYIDTTKPWTLEWELLRQVLVHVGVGLRSVAIGLYPFFPVKMAELLTRIGCGHDVVALENGIFEEMKAGGLPSYFYISEKWIPLYMRLVVE